MNLAIVLRWQCPFVAWAVLGTAMLGSIQPAAAATVLPATVAPIQNTLYSTNWSGYVALAGSGQTFTSVSGSWTVPTITGPSTGNAYSSVWVGIDGFGSSTVEQIGTAGDISNGTPSYYAWFEFYPGPGYLIGGLTITPGDQMSALVRYDGKSGTNYNYYLLLADFTSGYYADGEIPITTNAARTSAEWIAEAPTVGTQQSSLADFGSITFTADTAAINNGSDLAISVLTHTSIDMVAGGSIIAHTSALGATGDSFAITVVPEPATASLLALGAVGLLRRGRKTRG